MWANASYVECIIIKKQSSIKMNTEPVKKCPKIDFYSKFLCMEFLIKYMKFLGAYVSTRYDMF